MLKGARETIRGGKVSSLQYGRDAVLDFMSLSFFLSSIGRRTRLSGQVMDGHQGVEFYS